MLLGHKLNIRWMSKPCTQKADYSAAWHERKSIDTAGPSLHRAAVQNHRVAWKEKSNLAHLLADCQEAPLSKALLWSIIYMQVHMLDWNVRWIYSYWLSGYSWDRKLKCNVLTLLLKLYILDHLSPVPEAVHPHQLGPSPMPTKSLQPHCWTWEGVLHKCVIKCQHGNTMTVLTGSGFQGRVNHFHCLWSEWKYFPTSSIHNKIHLMTLPVFPHKQAVGQHW